MSGKIRTLRSQTLEDGGDDAYVFEGFGVCFTDVHGIAAQRISLGARGIGCSVILHDQLPPSAIDASRSSQPPIPSLMNSLSPTSFRRIKPIFP